MNCTLRNMCLLEDTATGSVLVQHRHPKATTPWCRLAFPYGHVEGGGAITASMVREIREETELTVSNLRLCDVVEWETIGYVTPRDMMAGRVPEIQAERERKLKETREQRKLANRRRRVTSTAHRETEGGSAGEQPSRDSDVV